MGVIDAEMFAFTDEPAVIYKPYTIIFTGDSFEYSVDYKLLHDSPAVIGTVSISVNNPPVAKDITTFTYLNTMKVRTTK